MGATGTQDDLEERLLDHAGEVIQLSERLPRTRAGTHIANQLLRCGTSPLPNHGEAQDAESVEDFVHKFKVCLKKLRESHRWLRLIKRVPLLRPASQVDSLLDETDQLIRIFKRSVQTATRNGLQRRQKVA
ncbi:four helix bundle protein [bacterium]|nr:four helix bundle protein [bacterium]